MSELFKSPYPALSLPSAPLRLRKKGDKVFVFDIVRKDWFVLTPEEWVRQHFIHFLVFKSYPMSLIAVEKQIFYNKKQKRFDLVVFSRKHKPLIVIECKASAVRLDESVFQQAAMYAHSLQVPYLCITNGVHTLCWRIENPILYFSELPNFSEL